MRDQLRVTVITCPAGRSCACVLWAVASRRVLRTSATRESSTYSRPSYVSVGSPASAVPANTRKTRPETRRRGRMDAAILATRAAAPKQTRPRRRTATLDRSAGRARDEAARAAVRAERVLAHEAGGLHRLRGGTIRCGGIDADRARRARVAEIVAAALDEKRSEPLFCGGLSHDARRGVSTGPASSGLDGRTGADNALVLTEIALIALKLVLQASHADPQQPGRLGAVPPGLF